MTIPEIKTDFMEKTVYTLPKLARESAHEAGVSSLYVQKHRSARSQSTGKSALAYLHSSLVLDLLCRIIPPDVSDGLELIREAGHCNGDNGEVLETVSLTYHITTIDHAPSP